MTTLRLHARGDLRLHDEPDPEPASDELLLRVTGVGLCGSDRHWLLEGGIGDAVLARPLVLGHEFVGTVEAGPRAGERLVGDPALPCGRCPTCQEGLHHLCPEVRFAGHGSTDGALRSRFAWPEALLLPVPDAISDVAAVLLEPLGVALHALDLGHVRAGARVGVFGCGPLGLLLVQVLRVAGAASIVAVDPLAHRVAAAHELGATLAVHPAELPAGLALDAVFEVAGEDTAVADAIDAARPGARVVLVGIPDGDRTSFQASPARRKGLTLLLCRRMASSDLGRAIALADAGRVELDPLVTEHHPLAGWPEAFDALRERRGLKVVVRPDQNSTR